MELTCFAPAAGTGTGTGALSHASDCDDWRWGVIVAPAVDVLYAAAAAASAPPVFWPLSREGATYEGTRKCTGVGGSRADEGC